MASELKPMNHFQKNNDVVRTTRMANCIKIQSYSLGKDYILKTGYRSQCKQSRPSTLSLKRKKKNLPTEIMRKAVGRGQLVGNRGLDIVWEG